MPQREPGYHRTPLSDAEKQECFRLFFDERKSVRMIADKMRAGRSTIHKIIHTEEQRRIAAEAEAKKELCQTDPDRIQ